MIYVQQLVVFVRRDWRLLQTEFNRRGESMALRASDRLFLRGYDGWETDPIPGKRMMSGSEWLICNDPGRMVHFIGLAATARQLHLAHTAMNGQFILPFSSSHDFEWRRLQLAAEEPVVQIGLFEPTRPDESELQKRAVILRDIFGNPFHPVQFERSWRTETTISLAQRMYDDQDFSVMGILADALEDAGCNDPQVLDHCRLEKIHVRGCWVVDGVLGR